MPYSRANINGFFGTISPEVCCCLPSNSDFIVTEYAPKKE